MFNILLKQIDKQINYKVTSDIAISHDLLVELRGGIAFLCGLKKLFQMVGPRTVIAKLVVLQADLL